MFGAEQLGRLMISANLGLASDFGQNNGYKLLPSQMGYCQSAKNDLNGEKERNEEVKKGCQQLNGECRVANESIIVPKSRWHCLMAATSRPEHQDYEQF